ncbi:hypothetical protein LTR20_005169 [Exophiala xenobiotica]|nr:hypothetical protein LTR40_000612 [Exophiala xenobiotica]KAK5349897.1 hypothetical protein LTR61_006603 [Exophiala xenobiotica]KAK5418006.1 hypothetical protein LTR90_005180 [Exophiala xenobiotica]KAK5464463.1 hypothetical protein LTR20_005169 [Exophiala xenobiotica]KAK5498223.1 hypothetical protein LTR26_001623 [Exophiala xenobiotica]
MESARAPGTVDHTFDQDHDGEWWSEPDNHENSLGEGSLSGKRSGPPKLDTNGLYDDGLIGVSISRVQTHLRSPGTPAAEKARAMDLSLDDSRNVMTLEEEPYESDDQQASRSQTSTAGLTPSPLNEEGKGLPAVDESPAVAPSAHDAVTTETATVLDVGDGKPQDSLESPQTVKVASQENANQIPKPSENQPSPPIIERSYHATQSRAAEIHNVGIPQSNRLSVTRNMLQAVGQEGRRRALSGPTALISSLKKFMPDFPSPPFNFSSMSLMPSSMRSAVHSGSSTPTRPQITPPNTSTSSKFSFQNYPRLRKMSNPDTQLTQSQAHATTVRPYYGLDGNVESLLSPVSPASTRSRPRSNSESSLYIGRRVSGVSAFDDTSAFAEVTGMANSRFKAITDSFQNSTLRFPKLPTIRPSPKRRISPESSSANPQITETDAPAPDSTRNQDYHYTSIKKMRNARKGDEVETPQQRAHPILSHALSKLTGDVVILGGYRGSILRSAQPPHRQLWVPVKVGLNLRRVDLEVGLTREDEERMEETIIPSGILSHIGPIDICRRLLKHMRKCPNARENKLRVHEWGYDWRLSPHLSSAKLIRFLESLECNHPETPPEKRGATVLAHSLGGLITRYVVNQRPELFAGVVYAGVPQHCVNILGPLRNGDDVLLSSRVLTAQVNFTLRTSFALLPESGRCFIQKHTNKRYDLDFFDPQVWEDYHLSPCINPPLPPSLRNQNSADRRKSIMDVISDNISSSKRSSWFGGQNLQTPGPAQRAEAATQQAADKAAEAGRIVEGEGTDEVVGPSMKQSQHRPTIATTSTIPKHLAEEYLRRTLAETLEFKKQLVFQPSHQEQNLYPPHAYMFGKTVPTVYGARVTDEEAIKYADVFDDLAFAAGDGVVLASAAQLPEGYRCVKGGRVESDRGHVGLMGDLEGVGRCIEAVIDARAKGVGFGKGFRGNNKTSSES